MISRPLLAVALFAEALALAAAMTLVADFHAHRASEDLGGVNIWGYRGPVMPQKVPDEVRIAIVGGDLAFGWGVAAGETTAADLRQEVSLVIDKPGGRAHHVTAVNLGAMGLPASAYATWLERYQYLQPDIVCVFVDPPGGARARATLPREESAVFASTGYVPMLPLVLTEKGASMKSSVVANAGKALGWIDREAYGVLHDQLPLEAASDSGAIALTIHAALRSARGVVIIAPPLTPDASGRSRHQALAASLATALQDEPRVRFVDLADDAELADAGLRLDGFNFSAGGHAKIATRVAPAVLDLVQSR